MTDSFKIQVSVKIPHDTDNYRDTMVNLRADTREEFDGLLDYISGKSAEIGSAVATLRGGSTVGQVFPGPGTQQVPQPQQGSWGDQGSQQAPPAFVPQQAAPAGPQGPAPQCVHGQMVYREAKPGSGKSWKAYFCPTPQNTPGQCKPEFLK